MRRALEPVRPGRTTEDAGILLDDLIRLVDTQDETDVMRGLMDTFTTNELEGIARIAHLLEPLPMAEEESPPPPPPPPSLPSSAPKRDKKKSTVRVSIAKQHSNAYERVRQMR